LLAVGGELRRECILTIRIHRESRRYSTGTPARFSRAGSLVQLSGRKRRNATTTGTSSRASVSETNVWQLAFLPSAEAYCEATPTECMPFFGTAVDARRRPGLRRRLLQIAGADCFHRSYVRYAKPRSRRGGGVPADIYSDGGAFKSRRPRLYPFSVDSGHPQVPPGRLARL
jgi:hypothetical protein